MTSSSVSDRRVVSSDSMIRIVIVVVATAATVFDAIRIVVVVCE